MPYNKQLLLICTLAIVTLPFVFTFRVDAPSRKLEQINASSYEMQRIDLSGCMKVVNSVGLKVYDVVTFAFKYPKILLGLILFFGVLGLLLFMMGG